MANINFSLTPLGGDVDKYVVKLYNSAGTVQIDSVTFLPTFPSTLEGVFSGVNAGQLYKVKAVMYIGSFVKECPFVSIVAGSGGSVNLVEVKYGFTDADTTGAPLTEGEYISSVGDAISANTTMNTFIPPNGLVSVDDFGNESVDKVLFILLPSTESAFTKWSEVGNIYQQNIDIDQSFSGSGVWFRSVQGANTYYITRWQTNFAGQIDFTR